MTQFMCFFELRSIAGILNDTGVDLKGGTSCVALELTLNVVLWECWSVGKASKLNLP